MPVGFRRLRKTVAIGDAVIFAWYGVFYGYISLRDGDLLGWVAIGVGVAALVLPFTGFFRSHLGTLASRRGFPVLVFLPNLFLIVMFGSFASLYLRDPFLTYNDMDTLSAVLFSGATLLAVVALIANTVAYFTDLRS